jgi:hypothetical protein
VEVGENVTTYNRDAAPGLAFPAQLPFTIRARRGVITSSLNYGFRSDSAAISRLAARCAIARGRIVRCRTRDQQYFAGDPRNANAPAINH